MSYLLKGLAFLSVLYALVKGISLADGWGTVFTWWVSGIVTGIVLYALGMILDYLENISARLHTLEHESNKKSGSSPPKLGTSKANLDKLKDFKNIEKNSLAHLLGLCGLFMHLGKYTGYIFIST